MGLFDGRGRGRNDVDGAEVFAGMLRGGLDALNEGRREATWWDAFRAESGEALGRAGTGIQNGWSRFTALFHREPAQRSSVISTVDAAQLVRDEAAARAARPAQLTKLLTDVQTYVAALEQRVAAGQKYNGFGSFLQRVLGFSDERLHALNIHSAQDKLKAAKHLEAAVAYNVDGTVKGGVEMVEHGNQALQSGRLFKLFEGLQPHERYSYEDMRWQKTNTPAHLERLNALSLDASIAALTSAVVALEHQATATEPVDKTAVATANAAYDAKNKEIRQIVANAKHYFDAVAQYCGRDKVKLTAAIKNDDDVKAAHAKYNELATQAQSAIRDLDSRAVTARTKIDERRAIRLIPTGIAAAIGLGGGTPAPAAATIATAATVAPSSGVSGSETTASGAHRSTVARNVVKAGERIFDGVSNFFHKKRAGAPVSGVTAEAGHEASTTVTASR